MFKLDSPFMNFLNKVADIMILNILVLLCSLPIVTMGASITAGYYIAFKMVKNEESYIVRGFFKSFKENFRQSTIMWFIMLAVAGLLAADFKIMTDSGIDFAQWMVIAVLTVTILLAMGAVYIFPMQARFSNTIKNTIRNSYLMALSHIPSTFVFIVSFAAPVALLYFVPQALPLIFLLAFGLMIYLKSILYLKVFKPYEEAMIARQQEEENQQDENVDSGIFAESEAMEAKMKEK